MFYLPLIIYFKCSFDSVSGPSCRSSCKSYDIKGNGSVFGKLPFYFGQYNMTEDCFHDKPSYKNIHGKVLYFDISYKDWNFGDDYEDTNIWSVGSAVKPDGVKSWTFYDASSESEHLANISVTCIKKGLDILLFIYNVNQMFFSRCV